MEHCVLTPRLLAVAELAAPCNRLADVGTDHAYLPIYMIKNGLCQSAYACDVNDGPLDRTRGAVARFGLTDSVLPVKSDGLHSVPRDFDALTVAGMGGDLIARILYERPPLCAEKIILQPMTKPEVLRRSIACLAETDKKMKSSRADSAILLERAVAQLFLLARS